MIKKVLVANRGEIAVRIIRACRELGLGTVAVYSDADRTGLHVRLADEAYRIGPAPSRESYLSIARIVDVAVRSGADAVHPGYGFLAENPRFAQARNEAGLIFVGPTTRPSASWATRWQPAGSCGRPASLSSPAATRTLARTWSRRRRLGFPLLIKAAAGGGGRACGSSNGRRTWSRPWRLPDEAAAAFGDDTVYLSGSFRGQAHRVPDPG